MEKGGGRWGLLADSGQLGWGCTISGFGAVGPSCHRAWQRLQGPTFAAEASQDGSFARGIEPQIIARLCRARGCQYACELLGGPPQTREQAAFGPDNYHNGDGMFGFRVLLDRLSFFGRRSPRGFIAISGSTTVGHVSWIQ